LADNKKANSKDALSETKSGVLTDAEIRRRLKRRLNDSRSLVITPPPQEIDKDSIDLRLGSCFFVPRAHRSPCFIPGLTKMLHLYSEQYVPYGSYLVLPAHHSVLGSTLEYIKLPSDVSGQILTKSSWGRTFITIEAAPWIHPLYRGCLTLEIANASNTPITLYPGLKVAQLILLKTMEDTVKDKRDKMEGTYVGPVGPEPAQLKAPCQALQNLQIAPDDMLYPFEDCFEHAEFQQSVLNYLKKHGYAISKPT
jgi:dCTP deaminase